MGNIKIIDITEHARPMIQSLDDGFTIVHLPGTKEVAAIPGDAVKAHHLDKQRAARLRRWGWNVLVASAMVGSFMLGHITQAKAESLFTDPKRADQIGKFLAEYNLVPWSQKLRAMKDTKGHVAQRMGPCLNYRTPFREGDFMVLSDCGPKKREWCWGNMPSKQMQCIDNGTARVTEYRMHAEYGWVPVE